MTQPEPDDDAFREHVEQLPFDEDFAREHLFPIFGAAVAFGMTHDDVIRTVVASLASESTEDIVQGAIEALARAIEEEA